jgi:homoprotocatechuate degradation regulator HpaR
MSRVNKHTARRSLPLLLLQTREAVMSHFRPLLREHGVSEQQWRVIRALQDGGPMEMGRLANICSLHGPSLTGMLTRMDQASFVTRSRFEGDQRKWIVALTPKAESLFERMRAGMQQQYTLIEQKLGSEEMEQLYAVLDSVIERLGGVPDEEADDGEAAPAAPRPRRLAAKPPAAAPRRSAR